MFTTFNQAHPDKALAETLHEKFPDIYKDANHKPELTCALTPFEAMSLPLPFPRILVFLCPSLLVLDPGLGFVHYLILFSTFNGYQSFEQWSGKMVLLFAFYVFVTILLMDCKYLFMRKCTFIFSV